MLPDICETLNLRADGTPRCQAYQGTILDYLDHIRARIASERELDLNKLTSQLLQRGVLQVDVLQRLLEDRKGTYTWDCCNTNRLLWDFESPVVQRDLKGSKISERLRKSPVARSLQSIPWPQVRESLRSVHEERVASGHSQGCAKDRFTPKDFEAALIPLSSDRSIVPTVSPDIPNERWPRPHLSPALPSERSAYTTFSFELGSSGSADHSLGRQSGSRRKLVRHRSARVGSKSPAAPIASPPPFVVLIPDSPSSTSRHSDTEDDHRSKPTSETPSKRKRTETTAICEEEMIFEGSLEQLLEGCLLGPKFVSRALASVCECAADFIALQSGEKVTYASPDDIATRVLPIQQSEDHWLLCLVCQGCPAILYDPRGSRESSAGIGRVREAVSHETSIVRSSPLFQERDGESEAVLLYMALCLVARCDIPAAMNMRFCRHLLRVFLSSPSLTDSPEESGEDTRVRLAVQRLVDPPLDISTWGHSSLRVSDAWQRVMKARNDIHDELGPMLTSARHAAELFRKLKLGLGAYAIPFSRTALSRIESATIFCRSIQHELANASCYQGSV